MSRDAQVRSCRTQVFQSNTAIRLVVSLAVLALPIGGARSEGATQGKYFVGPDKGTWAEGRAYCQRQGGDLATIETAQENEAVRDLVEKWSQNSSGCWIGANDAGHDGKWTWVDGTDVAPYANWRFGEPNNTCGGEDFAHMYPDGTWNDQKIDGSCGSYGLMQPVCERGERQMSRLRGGVFYAAAAGGQRTVPRLAALLVARPSTR